MCFDDQKSYSATILIHVGIDYRLIITLTIQYFNYQYFNYTEKDKKSFKNSSTRQSTTVGRTSRVRSPTSHQLPVYITLNPEAPSWEHSKNKMDLIPPAPVKLSLHWQKHSFPTMNHLSRPLAPQIQTMNLLLIILWHHWDFKKHVKAWHQINHLVQIMSDSQWLMQHMRIFHRNRAPFSVSR